MLLQADLVATDIERLIGQIQIAPPGPLIREHFAALHVQFIEHAILKRLEEMFVGLLLNLRIWLAQKRVVTHVFRGIQIDQNADTFPVAGLEHGRHQTLQVKRRK